MFELHEIWKADRRGGRADRWVLQDASATFPAGHKVALLGADPEANTAVLRIMSGVIEPDSGAIRRVGTPCWPFDFGAFVEHGATLAQNAAFLGRVYNVDAREVVRVATTLSGVKETRGKLMKQYLGAERKALAIGLTLSLQFDWYFVDQRLPKAPQETGPLIEAAIADRLSRASVVWATNDPSSLEGYCDAGLVLDQGALTFYNVFDEAAEAYLRSTEIKVPKRNDRKNRDPRRRRGAARRKGALDPQESR